MDLYSQRLITEDGHVIAERAVRPEERETTRWADTWRDPHGRRLLIQERYLDTSDWKTIGCVAPRSATGAPEAS